MVYYTQTHARELETTCGCIRGRCAVLITARHPSTLTNSTCWAGCCSSPADQWTGSSEADFIFVNDRCVNVHLCLDLCSHLYFFCPILFFFSLVYGSRAMSSPDPSHSYALFPPPQNILANKSSFVASVFLLNLILYVVPSVAWGEDGIDELHVVGYVYQELLVCTANFTYIYATSLSTLYSLCLLYTHIQHIE